MSDTRSIVDWLVDGGRSAPRSQDVMQELCDRLAGCGIPLWRAAVFVCTLHPHVTGRRFLWQQGLPVRVGELPFEELETAKYRESQSSKSTRSLRRCGGVRRAARALRRGRHGLPRLAALFHRRQHPGRHLGDEEPFGLHRRAHHRSRIGRGAVGAGRRDPRSAPNRREPARHLRGQQDRRAHPRRPHPARRHRVDSCCDLAVRHARLRASFGDSAAEGHDFAPEPLLRLPGSDDSGARRRSAEVHGRRVARHLSGRPRARRGARGLLARPLGRGGGTQASRRAGRLDRARRVDRVRFGLALHVGDVLYGNIGGGARLDFTCIGPAVNVAARLEKVAGKLGRAVVTSDEFARHCSECLQPLGTFALPGSQKERALFGLPDEAGLAE